MFRIEDKEHVYLNSEPYTLCRVFEQKRDGSFIHVGQAQVPGWDLSDYEIFQRWHDLIE